LISVSPWARQRRQQWLFVQAVRAVEADAKPLQISYHFFGPEKAFVNTRDIGPHAARALCDALWLKGLTTDPDTPPAIVQILSQAFDGHQPPGSPHNTWQWWRKEADPQDLLDFERQFSVSEVPLLLENAGSQEIAGQTESTEHQDTSDVEEQVVVPTAPTLLSKTWQQKIEDFEAILQAGGIKLLFSHGDRQSFVTGESGTLNETVARSLLASDAAEVNLDHTTITLDGMKAMLTQFDHERAGPSTDHFRRHGFSGSVE